MPLRVKCGGCGRDLVLDDVFGGTYCRCRYCRHGIRLPLPPAPATSRPAVRPDRPPPAVAKLRLANPPASSPLTRPGAPAGRPALSLAHSPALAVMLVCVIATALSVSAWQLSSSTSRPTHERSRYPTLVKGETSSADVDAPPLRQDSVTAFRTGDPLKTFAGVPLVEGDVIGYAADGDAAMAPFIESVAYVVNAVNAAIQPGTMRFGVVMATGGDGHTILEVAEPSCDLAGARSVLTARLPGGQTDLSKALSQMRDWDASRIFLLVAKQVDGDQLAILTETAEQTGAQVSVIAMGDAARQKELSHIATATGGSYLSLTPAMVNDWVARVSAAEQAAGKASSGS